MFEVYFTTDDYMTILTGTIVYSIFTKYSLFYACTFLSSRSLFSFNYLIFPFYKFALLWFPPGSWGTINYHYYVTSIHWQLVQTSYNIFVQIKQKSLVFSELITELNTLINDEKSPLSEIDIKIMTVSLMVYQNLWVLLKISSVE